MAGKPLIAVIGDASLPSDSPKIHIAESLGKAIVGAGYRLVTGGLGGVMEAACRGARRSMRYCEGDIIGVLPSHDPKDANPYVDIIIPSGLDLARNTIVAHADAVVAVGGGSGTLSEICFAWMFKRLIIAVRIDGWSMRLADSRLDDLIRYDNIADDRIYGVDNAEMAVRLIRDLLPLYRSSLS